MPTSSRYFDLKKALVEIANLFAATAKRKASSQNVPGVPEAIEVGTVRQLGASAASIRVEVNPGKMKNKEGRDIPGAEWAYEYGSGLYGPKGKKYKIEPDKKTVLAFPGSKSFLLERSGNSLLPVGAKGTVFFAEVEHPGVGARPFFSTALSEKIDEYAAIFAKHLNLDKVFIEFAEVWVA